MSLGQEKSEKKGRSFSRASCCYCGTRFRRHRLLLGLAKARWAPRPSVPCVECEKKHTIEIRLWFLLVIPYALLWQRFIPSTFNSKAELGVAVAVSLYVVLMPWLHYAKWDNRLKQRPPSNNPEHEKALRSIQE